VAVAQKVLPERPTLEQIKERALQERMNRIRNLGNGVYSFPFSDVYEYREALVRFRGTNTNLRIISAEAHVTGGETLSYTVIVEPKNE